MIATCPNSFQVQSFPIPVYLTLPALGIPGKC
jgi:hypothetical protein